MKKFINKKVIEKGQIQMTSYYQLPKEILDNIKYAKMKPNALKLYIKVLDITKVSILNGWKDEVGNYFVKFSQMDSEKKIGMSAPTFRGAKKELIELGLLFEKKQPQGLPSILYVLMPTSEIESVEKSRVEEQQLVQNDTIEEKETDCENESSINKDYIQLEKIVVQNEAENLTGGFGIFNIEMKPMFIEPDVDEPEYIGLDRKRSKEEMEAERLEVLERTIHVRVPFEVEDDEPFEPKVVIYKMKAPTF
ncbi:replication initiator protein A [Paenibacillus sp. MWE-103]|uniref:Replication initiator protein A n=1 Tax=Paenibacillus artemisiicola TaxID=1172618 RepID=A0ABS3WHY7_9BACL|nr:replication initiator protein A [Paenibacillus artemisiicola]MBO7747920.1 replication initiator protein A [Paenibacillus artemisiicola]